MAPTKKKSVKAAAAEALQKKKKDAEVDADVTKLTKADILKKFTKKQLLKLLSAAESDSEDEDGEDAGAVLVAAGAKTPLSAKAKSAADTKTAAEKDKTDAAATAKVATDAKALDSSKLDAPPVKFSGEVSEHESWARGVRSWYADAKAKNSDGRLGRKLTESLTGKAKTAVYAAVKEGEETFDKVMEVLAARFGRRVMSRTMEVARALAQCKRGKSTLREFLNEYIELRSKAEQMGEQFCTVTSGTRLLDAAELAASTQAQVLQTMALTAGPGSGGHSMPGYAEVMSQLETLAGVYENQDVKKKQGPAKEAPTLIAEEAQPAPAWKPWAPRKGKGKGKGGDKDKSVKKTITKPGGGGGKGRGKGKGKGGGGDSAPPICNYYRDGVKCPFEEKPGGCRFAHSGAKPTSGGAVAPP